ncbi:hypothetical protein SK128_015567 [Halocaridina rubra]|uniref:Uncharacterized protein n=1 Tax=Halocaridina rubra TaxID=373956 RepID=A0AAN8XDR7_HALRR
MKLSAILVLVGVALAAALPMDAPEPVVDTEEVAQAKAEFRALYDAAAAAAEAGAVPEVVIPEGAPESVVDTEEVAAAKAAFKVAYDAAAAAAEAAPDNDLDGALSTYTGYLSGVDGRLSPFYTNTLPYGAYGLHAPVLAGTPLVAAAPLPAVKSTVVAGTPLITGSPLIAGTPLAYNALGLHGVNGIGYYGYPGLHSPFLQVVKAEE